MATLKKAQFIDFLVILVNWKHVLISITFFSMIISYVAIYFFIDEEFEASSIILPSEDNSTTGFAGLMKNLKGLPLDIAGGLSNKELSTYNTIVYSRSVLDSVIDKFNLGDVYKYNKANPEWHEKLLKYLTKSITAKETKDMAYEITVVAKTPKLAADMTNYIVELLNNRIVELKNKKSKGNRIFLANRVEEIKQNLTLSEDSLRAYQEKSRIYDAKEQVKGLVATYTSLETNLITKQIEESILGNLLEKNSPKLQNVKVEVEEFNKKLSKLRTEGEPNGLLQSLNSLPKKTLEFLRYYREVEINSTILEFVIPLYEQAKFEEQKDLPILQVVDYAIQPVKKSFPPRTIFTILIGFGTFLIIFFFILIKENENLNNSEKYLYVRTNLFKWKVK